MGRQRHRGSQQTGSEAEQAESGKAAGEAPPTACHSESLRVSSSPPALPPSFAKQELDRKDNETRLEGFEFVSEHALADEYILSHAHTMSRLD